MNTGEFIKQKMHNMAVWIQNELKSPVDYVSIIDARSELELTTLCAMLHTKKDIETKQNWSALIALAKEEPALEHFVQLIDEVRRREDMHEKFWKYVKLFIDVMSE
jgi:hypothetical protein